MSGVHNFPEKWTQYPNEVFVCHFITHMDGKNAWRVYARTHTHAEY